MLWRDLLVAGHWFGFDSGIKSSWVEAREQLARASCLTGCEVQRTHLLMTFCSWYNIPTMVVITGMHCTMAESTLFPLDCPHQLRAHCSSIRQVLC